jgi:xylulokinase
MYYLGIDLGTSSVKVLAVNSDHAIVGEASREYPVDFPHDKWAEQNPSDWWEMTKEVIKEVIQTANIPADGVGGIGFSGQMHGLVALGEDNSVLFPAILWCDNRTEEECDDITSFFTPAKLREHTANKALTGFTAPKVLWVKKNQPELFEQIRHILLPKDYLRFKLTGDYVMDVSDAAGTLMLDVKNRQWSQEMLDYLEIQNDIMPSLCESYEVTGYLHDEALKDLGLTGKVKVVGGGGDCAVGAVGAGVVREGLLLVTLGTSGVVFAPSESFAVDDDCKLHVFCDATGKYHSMGVALSAANSLKWWTNTTGLDVVDLLAEAEKTAIGCDKVVFLPHLMGERFDANTKGAFIGMNMNTTRGTLTRAVLEGVSYYLKDYLEISKSLGVKVETVRVIGGGAQSPLWKQMLADVMNVTIEEINTNQGGALGSCILAMVGDGHFKTVEEGCEAMIAVSNTINPIAENVKQYEKGYALYKQAYPALKPWFDYANDMA